MNEENTDYGTKFNLRKSTMGFKLGEFWPLVFCVAIEYRYLNIVCHKYVVSVAYGYGPHTHSTKNFVSEIEARTRMLVNNVVDVGVVEATWIKGADFGTANEVMDEMLEELRYYVKNTETTPRDALIETKKTEPRLHTMFFDGSNRIYSRT